MYLAFVDDATQKPTRPGFNGKLIAAGALCVPADGARALGASLSQLCDRYGFPAGEEFKWSPGRECWMRSNLVEDKRQQFYLEVVQQLVSVEAFGTVVLEDDGRNPATSGLTAQQDVVVMLLERIANRLKDRRETGLVVADRPGGGRKDEDAFLAECLQNLEEGTDYVKHNEIAFVVAADSRMVRLLQAADLLTSCITAYVAGEKNYSPAIAKELVALLAGDIFGRRGGYGVKIHPDFTFSNLYYWLFGDEDFWKYNTGTPMPIKGRQYAESPDVA
jgi:hypothetical protein